MTTSLDVGATLREVFDTYRDQARLLLPAAFWLFLIVAVVNGLVGRSLALFPVLLIVSTIVSTLYEGMVVGLVRDVRDGRRDSSVSGLIAPVAPVLLPLTAAGILYGLGLFLGFLTLIVPGLIALTIWAVVSPVIVVERSGVFAAFGRSQELVRGHGWQVFGVIVVATLITLVVGLVATSIADSVANGPIVRIVFNAIASTFTAPIGGLAAAVLYFRLRAIQVPQAEPATPPPPAP